MGDDVGCAVLLASTNEHDLVVPHCDRHELTCFLFTRMLIAPRRYARYSAMLLGPAIQQMNSTTPKAYTDADHSQEMQRLVAWLNDKEMLLHGIERLQPIEPTTIPCLCPIRAHADRQ